MLLILLWWWSTFIKAENSGFTRFTIRLYIARRKSLFSTNLPCQSPRSDPVLLLVWSRSSPLLSPLLILSVSPVWGLLSCLSVCLRWLLACIPGTRIRMARLQSPCTRPRESENLYWQQVTMSNSMLIDKCVVMSIWGGVCSRKHLG